MRAEVGALCRFAEYLRFARNEAPGSIGVSLGFRRKTSIFNLSAEVGERPMSGVYLALPH